MIHRLSSKNSLVSQYIAELRDIDIQKDRMRFRRNLERIAEIAAYEISKTMDYRTREIQTPLSITKVKVLKQQPVIGSILRAGIAMHQGILRYFDGADNAFLSAYRKHDKQGNFSIQLGYVTCPDLTGKTLIMTDPMLATGSSIVMTMKELFKIGKPAKIHIVTAIACEPGIELVKQQLPEAEIWAGDIDHELDEHAYILPGLGDAGDLAYGPKLQQ